MGYKKYDYPTQMASIQKNQWRLKTFIDEGLSNKQLEKKESKLWEKLSKIAKKANSSKGELSFYPGYRLIGCGWEWAVYESPDAQNVIKIPADIFKEVNESEYLENTKFAYQVCKKHLGQFVVQTHFERKWGNGKAINLIIQRRLNGVEPSLLEIEKLDEATKSGFRNLAEGMLQILDEQDWMPDLHLYRKDTSNRKCWDIWNVIIENSKPMIFDFTAYYDVWRLYPKRTEVERKIKGTAWREFLAELR